jgi:spore coat protein U domain-containing protein, fimbrial subunit CupE1/2/3/6
VSPHARAFAFLVLFGTSCPSHAVITCQINGSAMGFGAYNVLSLVPLDSVGSITVTCTRFAGAPSVNVSVSIGPSQNTGGTSVRRMRQQGGTDLLNYNLFSDPGRSVIWGTANDAVIQQVTVPSNRGSVQRVFQIYGRILPGQNASMGNYGDSLTITVDP